MGGDTKWFLPENGMLGLYSVAILMALVGMEWGCGFWDKIGWGLTGDLLGFVSVAENGGGGSNLLA